MPRPRYSAEEIARRGREWYDRCIRDRVEADHRGQFLVLDIETGEYEIDSDDLAASKRLLTRLPSAELYGLRVGYPAAYHLAGRFKAVPAP
ncbi:MAG: hypothetical protein IT210_23955 [Armatimonadetes bacterium]|nr:hypothetical protein [Armatimonadota bacterium]